MSYPKISIYSAARGDGTPFLKSGQIQQDAVAALARHDYSIVDAVPFLHRRDVIPAIREANPKTKVLAYHLIGGFWVNPNPALGPKEEDLAWAWQECVHANNAVLYYTDGEIAYDYSSVCLAAKGFPEAAAQVLIEYLFTRGPWLWDGLFCDILIPRPSGIVAGGRTFDIARYGYDDAGAFMDGWQAGYETFTRYMRTMLDTVGAAPLTGNFGPGPAESIGVNGWMAENFPYQNAGPSDDPWKANMLGNQFGQPGYLTRKLAATDASWLVTNPSAGGPQANARKHRFGLGSASLGAGHHSFARLETDEAWVREHLDWWFPEYDYGGVGLHWLGEPVSEAHESKNGLWKRAFEFGYAVVNPTHTPLSVRFNERVAPPGSAYKTAWSVPGQDAMLLKCA